MIIGDRLHEIRQQKQLSLGNLEEKTGLSRRHIWFIESGQVLPPIETLEELASALEVELHQLFYRSEEPPKLPNLPARMSADDIAGGSAGNCRGLPAPRVQNASGESSASFAPGSEDGGSVPPSGNRAWRPHSFTRREEADS